MNYIYLVTFLISLLMTIYLIPKILLVSIRKRLIDMPNLRKVHTCLSSRLGGVAFFPSILLSVCVAIAIASLFDNELWYKMITVRFLLGVCACFLIYLVGVADDIKGVRYRLKFVYQIVAGFMITMSGTYINNLYGLLGIYEIPMWLGVPLTVFLIVFIMNAINLIDGIDGLASGLSLIAITVYGFVFYKIGEPTLALLAFATVGILISFIRFNLFGFPHKKVKIFMGDSGSLILGLILSILAIRLCANSHNDIDNTGQCHMLIAYSLLFVPCLDVVRVMIHRYKEGKPIFEPDKSHIHHKFLALGFSQHQTLLMILGISAFITLMNLFLDMFLHINIIITIDIVLWTAMHVLLSKRALSAELRLAKVHSGTIFNRVN